MLMINPMLYAVEPDAANVVQGELDEDQQAMLDKALTGEETEEEKDARITAGVLTDDEKADLAAENPDGEEGEEGKDKKSKVVPHARFNEVVMQRNFYETENADLKRKLAEVEGGGKKKVEEEPEYDYDEAEDRYLTAVAAGDKATAKAVRREINAQIQADAESNVIKTLNLDQRLEEQSTHLSEAQMVKAFTTQIEADFPQFNKASKDFDQDLVSDTLETYKAYVAGGMALSKAIEKATKLHAIAAGIDITKKPNKGLSDEAQLSAAERATAARKKGNDANQRQAPKLPGNKGNAGKDLKNLDADDIDVEQLTDEQFDALPEATKKKLRGDAVEA